MANETLEWFMVIVVLVVSISQSCVHGTPQVPCFFIFGDSLADNGNNNPLGTLAKVNYSPYGIDYPGGLPTGRFTNGKTTVDILGRSYCLSILFLNCIYLCVHSIPVPNSYMIVANFHYGSPSRF